MDLGMVALNVMDWGRLWQNLSNAALYLYSSLLCVNNSKKNINNVRQILSVKSLSAIVKHFYQVFSFHHRLMKEPLPVPTLPYGYGANPQPSMGMYQLPGSTAQQYPHVRSIERLLEKIQSFKCRI